MNAQRIVDAYKHLATNAKVIHVVYKNMSYQEIRALEESRNENIQINNALITEFINVLNNELPIVPSSVTQSVIDQYKDVLRTGKHFDQIGIINPTVPDYILHFVYVRKIMRDLYFHVCETPIPDILDVYRHHKILPL